MDKELRPKLNFYSVCAYVLGIGFTIFMVALLGAICCGCAALNRTVQRPVAYTGTVTFHSYVAPPDVRRQSTVRSGGPVVGYWDQPTYGIFTIKNGQRTPVKYLLDCGYYMPTVEVPALTAQDILVDTTPAFMDRDLCVVHETLSVRR